MISAKEHYSKHKVSVHGLSMAYVDEGTGAMFQSHREFAKTWPNQTHVQIRGGHFVNEDSPDEVGLAIVSWLQSINN